MNQSEELKQILPALIKVQQAIKPIKKEGVNPHFRSNYAEFDDVVEVCKKALNDNGIWLTQISWRGDDGTIVLETKLIHTSGEWISTELPVINKAGTDQGLGSSLSYVKRYSLLGILGVATSDDDGNEATGKTEPKKEIAQKGQQIDIHGHPFGLEKQELTRHAPIPAPKEEEKKVTPTSGGGITEPQRKRLFAIANKHGWDDERIKKFMKQRFGIDSTKQLTRFNYDYLVQQIEQSPMI